MRKFNMRTVNARMFNALVTCEVNGFESDDGVVLQLTELFILDGHYSQRQDDLLNLPAIEKALIAELNSSNKRINFLTVETAQ